jgi:hypothetical protein
VTVSHQSVKPNEPDEQVHQEEQEVRDIGDGLPHGTREHAGVEEDDQGVGQEERGASEGLHVVKLLLQPHHLLVRTRKPRALDCRSTRSLKREHAGRGTRGLTWELVDGAPKDSGGGHEDPVRAIDAVLGPSATASASLPQVSVNPDV